MRLAKTTFSYAVITGNKSIKGLNALMNFLFLTTCLMCFSVVMLLSEVSQITHFIMLSFQMLLNAEH